MAGCLPFRAARGRVLRAFAGLARSTCKVSKQHTRCGNKRAGEGVARPPPSIPPKIPRDAEVTGKSPHPFPAVGAS